MKSGKKERMKTEMVLPGNKVSYHSVISPHQTERTIIFEFGIGSIAMQCKNLNFLKKDEKTLAGVRF